MNAQDLETILQIVQTIDSTVTEVNDAVATLSNPDDYRQLIPDISVTAMPTLADATESVMEGWVQGEDVDFDVTLSSLRNLVLTNIDALMTLRGTLTNVLAATHGNETPLQLSAIQPNWYHLVAQFQAHLARKDTWTDSYAGSLGQTLAEFAASIGMFNQQGIEIAAREGFTPIARRDSSKYAGTSFLGVRIPRKSPANVKVTLTRTEYDEVEQASIQIDENSQYLVLDNDVLVPLIPKYVIVEYNGTALKRVDTGYPSDAEFIVEGSTITFGPGLADAYVGIKVIYKTLPNPLSVPSYSVFDIDGSQYFNRTNFTLEPSVESLDVILYEGEVRQEVGLANASGFQVVELAPDQFTLSEFDLEVMQVDTNTNTTVLWSKIDEGLWAYGPTDLVYFDRTNGRGITEIIFGDGVNGAKVPGSTPILFRYAVTSGALANRNDIGAKVNGVTFSELEGVTTSTISGGADEKSAEIYGTIAPQIFNAKSRIVTPSEYRAHLLNYPNISDVIIKAQKDIAPDDLKWMNIIRFCILPTSGSIFSDVEWADLLTYFKGKTHDQLRFTQIPPLKLEVDVRVTAYIHSHVDVKEIREPLRLAVQSIFTRKSGMLGRMVAVSDLVAVTRIEGQVDYVEIMLEGDTRDLPMPDIYTYAALGSLDLNIQYTKRQSDTDYPVA